MPWRLPGESHGVEVTNDEYYEAETPGYILLNCSNVTCITISVITIPTYSANYDQQPDELENFSEFFNQSEFTENNRTDVLEMEDFQPRMTNIALALALYLACIATVFGNSLVVIAVFKVTLQLPRWNKKVSEC